MHNRGRQLKPVGPDKRESAGATEPRREPDELDDLRRSRYFFLLAFFLAAGFLAAFFLAAMMVYLLHVTSDPMNVFGCAGPNAFMRKVLPPASVVASVMANREQHRLYRSLSYLNRPTPVNGKRHHGASEATDPATAQTVAMSAYA